VHLYVLVYVIFSNTIIPSETHQNDLNMEKGTIDLYSLVDECALVATAAGAIIRSVHESRLASGDDVLNASLKEAGEAKSVATIADIRAQRVITRRLIQRFPGLNLVGEEEDDPSIPSPDCDFEYPSSHPLHQELESKYKPISIEVPIEDLTIFIDPLDGTHEFVQRRVHNSTSLIGIAYHGNPIAGVISSPFADLSQVPRVSLVLAILLPTPFVFPSSVSTPPKLDTICLASSKTTSDPTLLSVISRLPQHTSITTPACGNKTLSLLLGSTNVCCFNLKCSLWDTCASTAILRAIGGQVTDLHGASISYSNERMERMGTGNELGVFATVNLPDNLTHQMLTAGNRECEGVTKLIPGLEHSGNGDCDNAIAGDNATASDIVRDIFGCPISLEVLSTVSNTTVTSYSAPEAESQRYLMSYCARIILHPSSTSLFYKRCVMRDLPHASLKPIQKLHRDVKSYLVELNFLASNACKSLLNNGTNIRVPKCFHHQFLHPVKSPLDAKFAMLLEDFSPQKGWRQYSQLGPKQMELGIVSLARFHAFFWNDGGGDLDGKVWEVASHWAPERQNPKSIDDMGEVWRRAGHGKADNFGDGSEGHMALGERVRNVAGEVARKAHPGRNHKHFTLLHGDAKAGNL